MALRKMTRVALASVIFCTYSLIMEAQTVPPPPPPPVPPGAMSGRLSKADSLLQAGIIKPAIEEYKKMYSQNRNNRQFIYNYACALSLNRQPDSSLKYLRLANKIDPEISTFTDPDLLSVRELKDWKGFEDELITAVNKKTGNSIRDTAYAKALWRLLCMDQSGFYEIDIAIRNLGPDSPVVTALWRFQILKNEKNLAELQVLLDTKGWPERSQVGSAAASAAFFVLQHSNAVAQEKYIKLFEAACRKGEGNCQQYALMFDRMRMNQNKPQRFGTHSYLDPSKGRTDELYPLEDEAKVDEWRKEIGLEPLNAYLERTGIKR